MTVQIFTFGYISDTCDSYYLPCLFLFLCMQTHLVADMNNTTQGDATQQGCPQGVRFDINFL